MTHLSAPATLLQHPDNRPLETTLPQRSTTTLLPGIGTLQELLRLMGMSAEVADQPVPEVMLQVLRVQTDGVLLHEGTRSGTLYVVRSGSFKCVRVQEDGYEQILTMAQPGELLGSEALFAGARQSAAVALEISTVYALPASELRSLQQRCRLVDEAVQRGLSRQLARAVETAEIMVAVASEVRLARFVLWLSARKAEAGQSATRLRLSMCRRDIASMLGVAHETVSRSFTTLAESGFLRVDNRDVEILDLAGLKARARCTRPGVGEHTQRPAVGVDEPLPTLPGWWPGQQATRPS